MLGAHNAAAFCSDASSFVAGEPMAKILFAWELGAGLGHVTCQRPLADELRRRGHEVVLAVRDVRSAAAVFADSGLSFIQCPFRSWRVPRTFRPLMTYAHLLHSIGFNEPQGLSSLTSAWRNLFELVDPDLIVFDHSPVALLGARKHRAKRALLGTGFCAPPGVCPMPQLRPWLRTDLAKLAKDEDAILGTANAALKRADLPPLARLGDLFGEIDLNLLTTYEELDHFGPRSDVRYWGAQLSCPATPPTWPVAAGKKIFAYLKKSPGLPELLKRLNKLGLPTIVFGAWVDDQVRRRFASNTLTLEQRPLDIARVAEQCDLAILNATHGTTAEFLLKGIPILQLPIFVEQYLTARNTAGIGAGLTANRKDAHAVAARLDQLLSSDRYAKGAGRFAAKYAHLDARQLLEEMIDLLEGLVA
jgi:UDP-N-acetylglucosamine:LPS N-acetylglucosamine transferase